MGRNNCLIRSPPLFVYLNFLTTIQGLKIYAFIYYVIRVFGEDSKEKMFQFEHEKDICYT